MLIAVTLGTVVLSACSSQTQDRASKEQLELTSKNVEFPTDIDVHTIIMDRPTREIELYSIALPADAFRRLSTKFGDELADGHFVSSVLYLALYLKDGELYLPTDVLNETIQARIFITIIGTDNAYDPRIRESEGVPLDAILPTDTFGGAIINNESDVFESDQQVRRWFLWDSQKYGQIYVVCDRDGIAFSRGELNAGMCTVSFQPQNKLILRITFPVQQIQDWESITDNALRLLDEWDLQAIE